ncbi:DUF2256 domain-containing protein [Salinispirillum sp. LH 10-3-1]|uniref:DUF2256 domain-containing protein n=1 Tax=Salinispirillum sp. LH 10-3-1 TaxID=2952525 RepID=A0AB38YFL6_9GAMM
MYRLCSKIRRSPVRKKADLPTKECPVCLRPFTWRKKWAKDWINVRYCSERCRRTKAQKPTEMPPA